MRNCANYNSAAVELLRRDDRVEKIDQDSRGWWRIRSFRSGKQRWIPASALGIRAGPPYYYMNVTSLPLRAGPSTGHRILTTLSLTQPVEMPGTGAGGWVAGRYLESLPVS